MALSTDTSCEYHPLPKRLDTPADKKFCDKCGKRLEPHCKELATYCPHTGEQLMELRWSCPQRIKQPSIFKQTFFAGRDFYSHARTFGSDYHVSQQDQLERIIDEQEQA